MKHATLPHPSTGRPFPPRPARTALSLLSLLTSAALSACSGGGGGGSSGDDGDTAVNEGSFTLDDFDYQSTHPPGYQPLGADGYQVLAREELFATWPGRDGVSRAFRLQEGPDAGHAKVPEIDALLAGQGIVQSAAGGQLDRDAESELVVATLAPAGSSLTLHRIDRLPNGSYARVALATIAAGAWSFADARVTLSDIDHDFRDELVIVARSARFGLNASSARVWVLDDPDDGGAQLLTFERAGAHIDLWGLPIDVDGDLRGELVVGLSGDSTHAGRYAVRLFRRDEGDAVMHEVHGWQYLDSTTNQRDSRAVVGDFDGDGHEDLAWIGYRRTSFTEMSVRLFRFGPDVAWHPYAGTALIDVSPAPAFHPGNWAATAYDPEVRRTDLALAHPEGSDYAFWRVHYDAGRNELAVQGGSIDRFRSGQGIALAASDVDADGKEDVQVALLHYTATSGTLDLGIIGGGRPIELVWQPALTLPSSAGGSLVPPVPVLAPGDYDADGFALAHTGVHRLRLSDPVPLVVLSAPPTVAGISQNYDDTESAYSTSTSSASSIGVSTYSSVTYSTGVGFDLFGILGVQGRASLEKGVERTETTTRRETVVKGFRGAHDADVVIFQGTLYESYEYVIVAAPDPRALGSLVTLDVPVDEHTYKWTVPFYNQNVAPEDRIGPDLLTHTPGEVVSYPTRTDLAALTMGEMHWDLPGVHPVGQGSSSDFQSVSFEVEQASEEQRTVTRGYGGGTSFGIDVGADVAGAEGALRSTSYALETTFEASVGDIADPSDYDDWRYNWGFSVHTVGRLADPSNAPAGYGARKHCFQYLRYWAEPTGAGF